MRPVLEHESRLRTVIENDPARMTALAALQSLNLADGWIGAGFVRDAVWDHLHGIAPSLITGDVDVIWFDPNATDPAIDRQIEARLALEASGFAWSVKNQARMHLRNGDAAYAFASAAMAFWPETATAVAVRIDRHGELEIAAPLGLADLFAPCLRPGPAFRAAKYGIFADRVRRKRWLERYPRLQIAD